MAFFVFSLCLRFCENVVGCHALLAFWGQAMSKLARNSCSAIVLGLRSVDVQGFRCSRFWWPSGFAKRGLQPYTLRRFAGCDVHAITRRVPFLKKWSMQKNRLREGASFLLFLSPFLFAAGRASLGQQQKERGKGRIRRKPPQGSGEARKKNFFG